MGLQAFSIHAHFYQPPREDPLTGRIPLESSAAPFPNWNERIHDECYRPNADLGNFERISFNIGPTLLAWLTRQHPDTYRRIVEQDRANVRRNGVGNALAQSYNHTILPLAGYQDKLTQVYWGIADFRHHFGRNPEGLWLPETAVDTETLEVIAQMGIRFTILAPWQADAPDLDPTEPYLVRLPSGNTITVFFYHSSLSSLVSFNPDATVNADRFALSQLQPCFNSPKAQRGEDQLVLIASDGELYGHHQMLRDRFLARLVDGASSSIQLKTTYPARWLQDHPVLNEIAIRDGTSWSCHHGLGRWRGECSCTQHPEWKARLRQALESTAHEIDTLYEEALRPLVHDPWKLRQLYIHVLLKEMPLSSLLAQESTITLTSRVVQRIDHWLRAQQERQRMFTSCGWFFEDFDRIEPKNNLAYAAQATQLVRMVSNVDLAPGLAQKLDSVYSFRSGLNARQVFENHLARLERDYSLDGQAF